MSKSRGIISFAFGQDDLIILASRQAGGCTMGCGPGLRVVASVFWAWSLPGIAGFGSDA